MTSFRLNLPTDIPWHRRCVSADMIDQRTGDTQAPYRWRSSIAIFDHEPAEEDQHYPDMVVSYLKVVCTITGYQESPGELGVHARGLRSRWRDSAGIERYLDVLERYYACFGAVLEVTVTPADPQVRPPSYPYFLDFEPKKRELYQVASETNERQSRSVESLNLTKSAGSTESLEVYDIDMGGGGFGVSAQYAGTGGSFNYQAPNGQWGTKRLNSNEAMTSRATDVGQEKRETYSFSTQLSQLYHQLDSYHLGTNRALFFVLPRPHTLETEHTFVNGLRNIEGIQEFFLVVARPRAVESFCVEAYLETGHIAQVTRTTTEDLPDSERRTTWSDSYHAQPKGDDDEETVFDARDFFWAVEDHFPGQGYHIGSATIGGRATIRYNYDKPNLVDVTPHLSEVNRDYLKVSGRVHSGFANHVDDDRWEEITYDFTVDITLVKSTSVTRDEDTLFMTARVLQCCPDDRLVAPSRIGDGVVYERALPAVVARGSGLDRARSLHNAVQEGIRRSTTDTGHRYPTPLLLHQTSLAAQVLADSVDATRTMPVRTVPGLGRGLTRKLEALRPNVTVADLLGLSTSAQRELFELEPDEVLQLRDALTGVGDTPSSAREVWLTSAANRRLFRQEDDTPEERRRGEQVPRPGRRAETVEVVETIGDPA